MTRFEARKLLQLPYGDLLSGADELRRKKYGNLVHLCAIINIRSGNCAMDCKFCAQSKYNTVKTAQFPLLPSAVLIQRIHELAGKKIHRIGLVSSGAALSQTELNHLCHAVSSLPVHISSRLCASLGHLSKEQMSQLKNAGITHYHHNLETSEHFYKNVCSTQKWQDRLATALRALDMGMELCSGALFGLGESWDDRIDLAIRLRTEGIKNIPLNFLHPHAGTPLGNRAPLKADEGLRIVALYRHLLPEASLRICGGRPETFVERQHEVFAAGANALITGDYLTTLGIGLASDLEMLKALDLQREPGMESFKAR